MTLRRVSATIHDTEKQPHGGDRDRGGGGGPKAMQHHYLRTEASKERGGRRPQRWERTSERPLIRKESESGAVRIRRRKEKPEGVC